MKKSTTTRKVKAWALINKRNGDVAYDVHTLPIFYHFGEASNYIKASTKFYSIVPCTITYELPTKSKKV